MNLLKIALESDARREEEIAQSRDDISIPQADLEIDPAPPADDTDPPVPAVAASDAARGVGRARPAATRVEGDVPVGRSEPREGDAPSEGEADPAEIDIEVELPDVEVDDEGTVIENGLGNGEEVESDLVRGDQEMEATMTDRDTTSSAMEELFVLESNVAAIISKKTYSADTAGLIRGQVNHQLSRINTALDWSAMESDGDDILAQHEFALEGIREGLKKIAQNVSMNFKHTFNAIGDMFRSTAGAVGKYEQQLANLEKKLNGEKGKWKRNDHQANLDHLWYFFTTDKGPSRDIIADATGDVAMSSYVLTEYHKQALDTVLKLIAVLGAARPQTTDQAKRAFAEVEKLVQPATQFKQEFLGGQPYFNKAGLVLNQGSKRTPVTFAGTTYEKIAALASPVTVVETSSLGHKVKKAFGSPRGGAEKMFQYKTDDVQKVINIGRAYVANVRAALASYKTFDAADNRWGKALDNFFLAEFKGEPLSPEDAKAYDRISFQLAQMSDNFVRNFSSPASAEMARSLRAAKYCGYMAATMIRFAEK